MKKPSALPSPKVPCLPGEHTKTVDQVAEPLGVSRIQVKSLITLELELDPASFVSGIVISPAAEHAVAYDGYKYRSLETDDPFAPGGGLDKKNHLILTNLANA